MIVFNIILMVAVAVVVVAPLVWAIRASMPENAKSEKQVARQRQRARATRPITAS